MNRYQVTSKSVQEGDRIQLGYGTLNITTVQVASVHRWNHNGYTNARLTLTNGETMMLWADTYLPLETKES